MSSGAKTVSVLPECQLVSFTEMPEALWVTTCVRNPCPPQPIKMSWNMCKPIPTRRTTQPLVKDLWGVFTEERGNQPHQPRSNVPLFEKSQKTRCKAAWVCVSGNPELQIIKVLLELDYGLKTNQPTKTYPLPLPPIFFFLASRSRWGWSADMYFSKLYYPLQYRQVMGYRWHTRGTWHMWTVILKWTCSFLKDLLLTAMQERWVLSYFRIKTWSSHYFLWE